MGEKGTADGVIRNAMLPPGFVHDGERAFNPTTGQNSHWDQETQRWTDSATGKALDPAPRPGGGSTGAR